MEDEKDNVEVLSDVLKDLKINGKNNQVQTLEKTLKNILLFQNVLY